MTRIAYYTCLVLMAVVLSAHIVQGERVPRKLHEKEVVSALDFLKSQVLRPDEAVGTVYSIETEKYVVAHGTKFYFTLEVTAPKATTKYAIEVWQSSSGAFSMDKMPRKIDSVPSGVTKAERSRIAVVSANHRHTLPAFVALSRELQQRGYSVTLFIPPAAKAHGVHYIGEIDVKEYSAEAGEGHLFDFCKGFVSCDYVRVMHNSSNHYESYLSLKDRLVTHDFAVIDRHAFAALDVADYHNMSYTVYAPSLLYDIESSPHYTPVAFSGDRANTDILQRIYGTFVRFGTLVTSVVTGVSSNRARYEDKLLYRTLADYYKNSTVMVGTSFGFEVPRPISPSIQMLGVQIPPPVEPLNEHLTNWLDVAAHRQNPVILIQFSNAAPVTLKQLREVTLALQNYTTMWILPQHLSTPHHVINLPNSETRRVLPANVSVHALAHGAIKASFSDCDAVLVQTSLRYGIPVACAEMLPDQVDVGARMSDLSAGQRIDDMKHFTSEMIARRTGALLQFPQFAEGAARAKKLLSEGQGIAGAADHVESAMHSDTVRRLISIYPELKAYKQWCLDIILALVVIYVFSMSVVTYFGDMFKLASARHRAAHGGDNGAVVVAKPKSD